MTERADSARPPRWRVVGAMLLPLPLWWGAALVFGDAIHPFILMLIPVLVAGWWGGLAAGLGATLLAAIASWQLAAGAHGHAAALPGSTLQNLVGVASLIIAGVIASLTLENLRRRNQQLLDAQRMGHESEQRIRAAFSNSNIGWNMADTTGRIVAANAAMCALLGHTEAELLERDFKEFIHPDDRAENLALIERLLASEIPHFTLENRYRRDDGHVVWVRKSISLMRDQNNQPHGILAMVEDIS